MKHLRTMAAALTLLGLGLPSATQARVVEKIVALVGDDIILQSEVEDRVAPMMAEIASIANPTERDARAKAVAPATRSARGEGDSS